MKKLLIVLLTLVLFACSTNDSTDSNTSNETKQVETTSLFIKPINDDGELFDYLNDETKNLLYAANGNSNIKNDILKNLGASLIEGTFTDYYGNVVDLADYKDSKLVIEIVATWCSHCKDQALYYNEELLEALGDDATLIQYFGNGEKEDVSSFYKEIGLDVPNNIIVGINDNNFSLKLSQTYNITRTPTFLFFKNGVLAFERTGTTTASDFVLFKDIAFNDGLDLASLTTSNGESIFDYVRETEDVKKDLSEENYNKLVALDNDNYTASLTLEYIGKEFDFYNQLQNESDFNSEVEVLDYVDKEFIVIFVYNYDEDAINMINEFTSNNPDINLFAVNLSDEENEEIASKLDADLVSIMNQIPDTLNTISVVSYPSAIFVKENTITGVYSNIESSDKLLEAYNIFLTDNSIALLSNN